MSTVIKVENISKQYRLGKVGLGSLSHDINRWYQTTLRGKEDPYLKIGEANDRSKKGESDYVWALQDINFEVKQGEVLGIIGRNGAGKSTLLKILSRTTTPTTGQIKIKGRVASLLEVGTGFHPELTGRENIFLNGAILGMSRQEIKSKFDEIVNFAGVERYIDTPVKRYSSGMYVRLAFGVAAHLEPEILIVDEVLAVGDAEFQKKALGKMKDVSAKDGRTVLFVSHNMAALENLCDSGIVLHHGRIGYEGTAKEAIKNYFANQEILGSNKIIQSKFIKDICMLNHHNSTSNEFEMGSDFTIQIKAKGIKEEKGLHLGFFIKDVLGQKISAFSTAMKPLIELEDPHTDVDVYSFKIRKQNLLEGKYLLDVSIAYKQSGRVEFLENVFVFNILSKDIYGTGVKLNNHFGKIYLDVESYIQKKA